MHEFLLSAIPAMADIPASEVSKLADLGRKQTVNLGDYFIRAGQIPKKFGFVVSGLFRYVYVDQEGKEFTKAFMPEKSVISSYSSMIRHEKSYFSIEALEDAEVIAIEYTAWNALRQQHACWDKFLIALLEKGYSVKEKREREFLLLDSEKRYKTFLEEYPGLESRVKQYMIASYLGITPVALSRIRRKIRTR